MTHVCPLYSVFQTLPRLNYAAESLAIENMSKHIMEGVEPVLLQLSGQRFVECPVTVVDTWL